MGLSWTDHSLMKSLRGRDKRWYRADNACCQTDEHTLYGEAAHKTMTVLIQYINVVSFSHRTQSTKHSL